MLTPPATLMRTVCAAALLLLLAVATAPTTAQSLPHAFNDDAIGAPPAGFFFGAARQASPGTWEVRGVGARRHLVHIADPSVTLRGIALAGIAAAAPADVGITSRIRLVDGDRTAGLMWRYEDAANFYAVGVQLTARTATLFRVTAGNRVRLDEITDLNLDGDAWHTLSATQVGDQMQVQLDGLGILRARDSVFRGAGRAGVWSAGNSTTWFDDLRIAPAEGLH